MILRYALVLLVAGATPAAVFDWKHGTYEYATDPSAIRFDVVDTVARKLGINWVERDAYHSSGREPRLADPFVPKFRFIALSPHAADSAVMQVSTETKGRYVYGFLLLGGAPNNDRKNTAEEFLLSAYRQELDPAYKMSITEFETFGERDAGTFYRRNWLSSGYALQSLPTETPFARRKGWLVATGYVMDVYPPLIAVLGLISGKNAGEKAAVAGVALGVMGTWRIATIPLATSRFRTHNHIVRSGYKIPKRATQ